MAAPEPVVDIAVQVGGALDPGVVHGLQGAAQRLLELLREETVGFDLDARPPPSTPVPPTGGQPIELSILLTDDAGIRPLNRAWRDVDAATDVLAFPLEAGPVLGDVVISVETAGGRVTEHWGLDDELVFLLVHGLLHLLGHDHHEAEDRVVMEGAEQALWTALGRTGTLRAGADGRPGPT